MHLSLARNCSGRQPPQPPFRLYFFRFKAKRSEQRSVLHVFCLFASNTVFASISSQLFAYFCIKSFRIKQKVKNKINCFCFFSHREIQEISENFLYSTSNKCLCEQNKKKSAKNIKQIEMNRSETNRNNPINPPPPHPNCPRKNCWSGTLRNKKLYVFSIYSLL